MREPAFNELFEAVTAEMSAAILNTAIGQGDARQEYYLTYHGMRSFAQTLNRYVIEKDGIIQAMNEDYAQGETQEEFDWDYNDTEVN